MSKPTGTARLTKEGDQTFLTITTDAKRGKKTVHVKQVYLVENLYPDERVANPAFALKKGSMVQAACDLSAAALECGAKEEFVLSGDVWHICVDEYGPRCDCPFATYRKSGEGVRCKHILSALATRLIPERSPVTFGDQP